MLIQQQTKKPPEGGLRRANEFSARVDRQAASAGV
jgi:hypothetical protein